MGWKTSMIFANSEKDVDLDKMFAIMGMFQLQKVDRKSFDAIMNPDDDKIYIGKFNGNTIICMQNTPLESFDEDTSSAEYAMSEYFENTDIVTLVLHSVINLWGYSITRDQDKVRVRAGSSESGTIVEYGEPLEEEKELLSKAKLNADGQRVFVFEDMPNDEFLDDQVGEDFVFDISAKYFGERMDRCDGLFETMFDGYTYSNTRPKKAEPKSNTPKPKSTLETDADKKNNGQTSPWWKFW